MKKIMMLSMLFAFAATAQAADYDKEMQIYVMDPCIKASIEKIGTAEQLGVSDERALDIMRELMSPKFRTIQDEIMPLLRGAGLEERHSIYQFLLLNCLNGVEQGS